MKFIKEWSEWNPTLNKKVLDYIETNKINSAKNKFKF
jgi:hypothetical protein